MMNKSIYSQIIASKTGLQIPVLQNGKTIESRYNPEREAESQLLNFEKEINFFLIIGIGSGILIKKIHDCFENAKIIAVENSICDIEFLKKIPLVKELSLSKDIFLCSRENLSQTLCQNYLPALHGNLKLYENRVWINENKACFEEIQRQINDSLAKISADFSVQAHFGKIWQSNIMKNLKLAARLNCNIKRDASKKKAAVIAAGPSLDKTIEMLKGGEYFIIATDTAFSSLLKQGIIADAVLSLDGQTVSYNHYMHKMKEELKNTVFYFDLSSNFSAAKKIYDSKLKICYFSSGHPLSNIAREYSKNSILSLYSGSGTVTITALDLAVKYGFTQIDIFGADFSYSEGKAYSRGTYLDTLYSISSFRKQTEEGLFAKLMFRTELIEGKKGRYSTKVLESYKESLENYLKSMNLNFVNSDDLYRIKLENNQMLPAQIQKFNYEGFIKELKSKVQGSYVILLPYIAWLRKKMNFAPCSFESLCKVAEESLLSYN